MPITKSEQLKSISFYFENCEGLSFPANVIGDFETGPFQTKFKRIGNMISRVEYVDKIFIELFRDGNIPYITSYGEEKPAKFERLLEYSDIVSIDLEFYDGSKASFYVEYDAENEDLGDNNKNQKSMINDYGNLYILIDKDENDIVKYIEKINKPSMRFFKDEEAMLNSKHSNYEIGITPEFTHPYSINSLPDLYRYVYLNFDDIKLGIHRQSLACRVYDKNENWKFIYPKDNYPIPLPTSWEYVKSNAAESIDDRYKNFSMEWIKEHYPPLCLSDGFE